MKIEKIIAFHLTLEKDIFTKKQIIIGIFWKNPAYPLYINKV